MISWNEFSENSYVEPSRRYGGRYLEMLAEIRGNPVQLATEVDSTRPTAHGAGWQVPLLGLLAIGMGCALFGVRKRERARPTRRVGP